MVKDLKLENNIIQVDTGHKPIRGSTVFNCVLLEYAKQFAKNEREEGCLQGAKTELEKVKDFIEKLDSPYYDFDYKTLDEYFEKRLKELKELK